MSSFADAIRLPHYRPNWLTWLRREMAPFPGRDTMTVRIIVTVTLVVIISMALQVPNVAYSAFFILFVTKQNRALTLLTGVVMIIGMTIATAASLFIFRFTFDHPELRVPVMAGFVFTGMFLSRVFILGPLGFVIGFFSALIQTTSEAAPDTDSLVRGVLWLWVAVAYPITLTIFINQLLLPTDPWPVLVRTLAQRLDAAAAALRRNLKDGSAGGQTNPALLELATRGSSPLLALLNFAESKEAALKRRHASLVAAIAASEHLLSATAALELRQPQKLSADDLECVQPLLDEIAELKAVLPEHEPVLGPRKKSMAKATLPQLRELQFALESFRDGLIRYISEDPKPTVKEKKHLFIPDAFTNPSHVRFALKVTFSAMICYLIYSGLKWPGISTAFVTCCFIALENTGATIRKAWLRLIGCAIGGAMGYFAIFFCIPYMESITSLVLLTAAAAAITGWIAAGTDRISYAGLQAAFAFFLCVFQSYAPEVNFTTARDRLVGIVMGIVVSSIILRFVWPEHAIDSLRATLGRLLRNLSQLLTFPKIGAPIETEIKAAETIRATVTKDLDNTLRLTELIGVESMVVHNESGISLSALERLTANTQALCLMTSAMFAQTKIEEWQQLDPSAQQAENVLRACAARQLQQVAAYVETSHCPKSVELELALADWNKKIPPPEQNDRPRLVRRVVDQVRLFP